MHSPIVRRADARSQEQSHSICYRLRIDAARQEVCIALPFSPTARDGRSWSGGGGCQPCVIPGFRVRAPAVLPLVPENLITLEYQKHVHTMLQNTTLVGVAFKQRMHAPMLVLAEREVACAASPATCLVGPSQVLVLSPPGQDHSGVCMNIGLSTTACPAPWCSILSSLPPPLGCSR